MERLEDVLLLESVKDVESAAIKVRKAAVRIVHAEENEAAIFLQADVLASVKETSEGWLCVTLPAMLPRRKEGDRARFLTEPLKSAVLEFARSHPIPHFTACVLVYEHIYAETSRRRFVDHDNLELKHCQDVLENFFLENDSSSLCSAFQCSHRGRENSTKIWILSPEQFPEWLKKHSECWNHTP